MKPQIIKVLNISFFVLFTVLLNACGGGSGGGSSSSGGSSTSSSSSSSSSSAGGASPTYSKADLVNDLAGQLSVAYTDVETSFGTLLTAANAYCAETTSTSLFDDFKNAWLTANNDWQYVQGINFGPVNENNRRFNIAIYPNDPTRLDERISSLINGSESISQTLVSQLSADLQGLTALERLLFKERAFELFTVSTDVERNCSYVVAVAENLGALIDPVESEWQSSGSYYQSFINSENTEQSLEDWFGAVAEYLQIIRDSKLLQVAVGNTRFIEAPLAQISLDNIQQNVAFLDDAFSLSASSGLSTYLTSAQLESINSDFQTRLSDSLTLIQQGESLSTIAQADGGPDTIESISQGVQQVLEYFATTLAEGIDIFIGFNGADGD